MPGETPEKAAPPLVKKTSIVGALRTGDVKGAVTGVLTAAPLLETKKEKAARHWSVFRAQAPPKFLAQGSPRCAIDLEEDVHVPGQYESQPDGWNVTSLQIKPAYDREISPYADCDGGRTPRAKVVTLQETEEEAEPAAATVEDQPAGWFETSLQIEEKYPAHVTKIRGEDVRRSNSAVYNDEGEDEFSPSLDQPDGWNVTSLQLDPDRQAAVKIQAMRRGSKGRSDAEATRAENQATSPLRQRIGSAAGAAAGGLMRGLSSLSSSIIGASVEDAKEDMTPEQAAAAKAAAERGRRRSVGEEERVVGEEDAAEAARRTAAEAARQSAAKRTAEQTAEATAAELTSDGMEYDRLIHAHRSSIAREEGELARAVAAEVTEEVAREEAHAAAKRRASVREEEEVKRQRADSADPASPLHRAVHYGGSAKLNSKDSAPPALIKVESAVVPSDAGEDVHVPGEHEGQPDGWNVTSLMIEPDYDLKKIKGDSRRKSAVLAPEREIFSARAEEDEAPSAQEQPDGWHTTSMALDVGEDRKRKAAERVKRASCLPTPTLGLFGPKALDCHALEQAIGEGKAAELPAEDLKAAEAVLEKARAAEKAKCEKDLRDKMKARPLLGIDKPGLSKALTRAIQVGLPRELLEQAAAKLPEASRPHIF